MPLIGHLFRPHGGINSVQGASELSCLSALGFSRFEPFSKVLILDITTPLAMGRRQPGDCQER
jgi:hypothetical protein